MVPRETSASMVRKRWRFQAAWRSCWKLTFSRAPSGVSSVTRETRSASNSSRSSSRLTKCLEADILDAVTELVGKSVLSREPGPDGGVRYRLLHTFRRYGLDRLRKRPGEERA